MILISGTVRLPPENVAKAKAPMQTMIETTRGEDGCLEYAYSEDILDPGLIHVNERWASRDHLDAHMKTAHMGVWRSQGPELGITDRYLLVYEVGEPIAL